MKYINPYRAFVGAFLPNWLLKSDIVSLGAKVVYARLCQYAGDDGVAFPTRDVLANECCICLRTVARHLDELQEAGLIEVERMGLQRSNRYHFVWHEAMDFVAHPDRVKLSPTDEVKLSHPIRRESGEENQKNTIVENQHKRFVKPTIQDIKTYFNQIGLAESPQRFFDYYESKGWVVGKSKMKCWKAAARTWLANRKEAKPNESRVLSAAELEMIQR